MKALIVTASLAMLSALASAAPLQPTGSPPVLTDIRWDILPAGGKGAGDDEPHLRIRSDRSSSSLALDGSRPEVAAAKRALAGGAGPVAFTVAHQAGTLACDGRLSRRYEGKGDCRFTADPGFEQALAKRGIAPDERRDLLAMLLVDATVELADGLADAGLRAEDAGELIAAAALHVTPAYVRDLRAAPMKLASLDDAFACRALGVDAGYVRELADAGYTKLSVEDVVSLKALGVSGDYARRMNAAATEANQ
ncbi:hypothetical protein [Sphingopyxis sp. GW247-27LB]|uniref:hypothetical protein n=1 Tax=Sphingopyxis sp. GW247-27LB TaxID=2012632 RepID=UPI000BA7A85C|nr:hypothetical protein [Sphingopyxis sp. GW247-27LB]PAL20319.1 hypothetical protein CD928_18160 [Sphingopyxis sp. GW247-27LB]